MRFFVYHLRNYINKFVLGEKYADDIEAYGYIDGKYVKLSEKIQQVISQDVKAYIREISQEGTQQYIDQICASHQLIYSKKSDGDRMLRNLVPVCLAKKCRRYFAGAYVCLHDFK